MLDLKRVETYIKLGWSKEEALDLVKAEAEEEQSAKKDFEAQTQTETKEEKKEQETFTKADVEQMIANALNQKETQKEIPTETMSAALKKLV